MLFEAVSETRNCLPDAIQLLTPCTVGNGWLKIINLGRFALSLFDKHSGKGVRVFVDAQKIRAWPEVAAWLFKLRRSRSRIANSFWSKSGKRGRNSTELKPSSSSLNSGQAPQGRHWCCNLCGEPYPVDVGRSAGHVGGRPLACPRRGERERNFESWPGL